MRSAEIYYHDVLSGILTETDEGYFIFKYDEQYVLNYPKQFLTFTMPVSKYSYGEKYLFSFFDIFIKPLIYFSLTSTNFISNFKQTKEP